MSDEWTAEAARERMESAHAFDTAAWRHAWAVTFAASDLDHALTALAAAEQRAAKLVAALEHVRDELNEHGDERGWFYGDCYQDCLDAVNAALTTGESGEG